MRLVSLGITLAMILPLAGASRLVRAQTASAWTQWGGPTRNFMSDAKGLASSWPAGGPRKLWTPRARRGAFVDPRRERSPLHDVSPARRCRLRSRRSQEEIVAALDAATGKTLWEFSYPAPTADSISRKAPARTPTPLIVGNRLFATSSRKELFALDKTTGKRIWSHDIIKEYGAPAPDRGYTCSPILYNGTIIVTWAAPDRPSRPSTSRPARSCGRAATSSASPASPILIDVDGQQQLVVFGGDRVAGIDPGEWTNALEPSAQDRLGAQHQHARLVAGGSSAVRLVGVQHGQPRARAASGGGQDDGDGEVVHAADARPHRHGDPAGRLRLRARAAISDPRFSPPST